MPPKQPPPAEAQPARNSDNFLDVLTEIDGGHFLQAVGDQLAELVERCSDTNRKGSLGIVLKVKPSSKGSYEVIASIEPHNPKPDAFGGIFFANAKNHLVRRDPRQPELPGISGKVVPMASGD